MSNEESTIRPQIININYPYSVEINKYSGSYNNNNDPYAKLCVPDVVKNMNAKVFNLISKINKTRHIKWNETCKCICRLDASICNNKQRWISVSVNVND